MGGYKQVESQGRVKAGETGATAERKESSEKGDLPKESDVSVQSCLESL